MKSGAIVRDPAGAGSQPRPLSHAERMRQAGQRVTAEQPGKARPSDELTRLHTPEEAAAILSGHPAPFSARAGDVTPGGLRAAAHRREIPFRLWRGKVRFTGDDLRTAVLLAAVPISPPPAETRGPCGTGTSGRHPGRRLVTSAARENPVPHGTAAPRRLIARKPGRHGTKPTAGGH
jgi:hypothetical protein